MKIKVIYSGYQPASNVDKAITAMMKEAGATWTGQGYNLDTQERDICFEAAGADFHWPPTKE